MTTDRDQRFERLRTQYTQSLPAKHAALTAAWHAFAATPEDASLRRELSMQLHRLSGSAGAYGHDAIGARARAADQLVGDAARGDVRQQLPVFEARVQAVLDELANTIASAPPA